MTDVDASLEEQLLHSAIGEQEAVVEVDSVRDAVLNEVKDDQLKR